MSYVEFAVSLSVRPGELKEGHDLSGIPGHRVPQRCHGNRMPASYPGVVPHRSEPVYDMCKIAH